MGVHSFSGSYEHSLDGKGRVIIPAAFRDMLGEHFTMTINPNKTAVAIYPQDEWQTQLERLSKINPMDQRGMQYVRYVMSVSYADNIMDNQGRVLVPAKLRQKIGLIKDIVFVGMNNYIEIWDARAHSDYESRTEDDFGDLADYVYETYPS